MAINFVSNIQVQTAKNDGPEGQCLIEIGEINQEAGDR